jgi:MOSC domain-containing protein
MRFTTPSPPMTNFFESRGDLWTSVTPNVRYRMIMYLSQIWRYPVKSMKGEPLQDAQIGLDGIEGDRIVQVRTAGGKIVSARTRPELLRHQATLGPNGEPLVDGRAWTDPEVDRDVKAAAGPGTSLVLNEGPERFDIRPLLVATDGAIAALGEDGRRLRPNLVIGGVPGLEERTWEGRRLKIGPVVVETVDLRSRCIMTTFHPDTLEQDTKVLQRIYKKFGGVMALNTSVIAPGRVSVGDPVTLLDR